MRHLLLATEAAEGGGGGAAGIAILVALVALAIFAIAYFVVGPGRSGPSLRGDIPLAKRPYHSDEELEGPAMERSMSWGVALAAFAALFLMLYALAEPARINDKKDEFYRGDLAQGRQLFAENCASCHGTNADGGFAAHPDPEVEASWPVPALNNIMARYEDSEIVTDVEEFMTETIKQGRAGTPMPAWGTAYKGPLNDQQIASIVDYVLSIQTGEVPKPDPQAFAGMSGEEIFADNCARCHGQEAQGRVGPSLLNVLERFGWSPGDPETLREAREAIRSTLLTGRNVPGSPPNMPSFADVLTEDAVTAVIDYLESIQQTGGPRVGQIGETAGDSGAGDGGAGDDGGSGSSGSDSSGEAS